MKTPDDLENNIKDLKVLGKREVMSIVKLRNRVLLRLKKTQVKPEGEKKEKEDTDEELENQIHSSLSKKMKQVKKEKERLLVKVSKQQVSGNNDDNNIAIGNEEELFSLSQHRSLKKIGFEITEGYVDIEGDEEMDREQYLQEHPRPLRNRHSYKKVDPQEMESNIEHLYDLRKKRKVSL